MEHKHFSKAGPQQESAHHRNSHLSLCYKAWKPKWNTQQSQLCMKYGSWIDMLDGPIKCGRYNTMSVLQQGMKTEVSEKSLLPYRLLPGKLVGKCWCNSRYVGYLCVICQVDQQLLVSTFCFSFSYGRLKDIKDCFRFKSDEGEHKSRKGCIFEKSPSRWAHRKLLGW